MNLYKLFSECLNTKYIAAGCCANYALRKSDETLYIFFEKSVGKHDWKNNFTFSAAAYEGLLVHSGFLSVWQKIKPQIEEHIFDKSLKSIIITGYSHGAAIALLCHLFLQKHRQDIKESIQSYGFGCPRVVFGIRRKEAKKQFKNFTVVRNTDDIVTHLPPAIFGFFHVGNMLKIGKKGTYSKVNAHREENILNELKKIFL